MFLDELNQPFKVKEVDKIWFRENGFIKFKNILSKEVLNYYEEIVTQEILAQYDSNEEKPPNSSSETYEQAFKQVMNLWVKSESVRNLVFSKKLAGIGAQLMGVKGVRLYHDQALYKMERGGFTPWHVDQYYWPFSNTNTCTVWIPFQKISRNMGPLSFSMGSHLKDFGRDFPISDESEKSIKEQLEKEGMDYFSEPFDLGEVSFHSGWTFHHAPGNYTDNPRKVMTMIYMEDGIKLSEPKNENQIVDWKKWMPEAEIGLPVDTPLNPVLYQS